ncbi:SMI1/KNR4 family protein [Halalkalibacter kiskunsagensis]|uniref:SMI1/KNR4 family protein n=1 Tax=Halalkalibacter kiskunsagensis TaxID=1548599 RepID=A0ABV6KI39_9BACI
MSLRFYKQGHFWKSPSEYKPGEKVTDETLLDVETHLGFQLPKDYVALMKEQNGGELTYRYVLFADGDAAIIPYFHELDVQSGVGLSTVFVEECGLPDNLVLLTGDLHTWLALDYRYNVKEPAVVYITEHESGNGTWQEHFLAHSFEEFTKRLFQKEDSSL